MHRALIDLATRAAGHRDIRNLFNRTRSWERYFLHRDTR